MPTGPLILVLAGPNGAGKSTSAAGLLPADLAFVNADEIAKTLPAYPSRAADFEAGRIAIARMDQLQEARESFAVETTLASRSLAPRVAGLRENGYTFRLVFLWSPSPEFSIARVAARVASGGHDIPEPTIRRRYALGIANFFKLYRPLADEWEVHDSTQVGAVRRIAEGRLELVESISDPIAWEQMRTQADVH